MIVCINRTTTTSNSSNSSNDDNDVIDDDSDVIDDDDDDDSDDDVIYMLCVRVCSCVVQRLASLIVLMGLIIDSSSSINSIIIDSIVRLIKTI